MAGKMALPPRKKMNQDNIYKFPLDLLTATKMPMDMIHCSKKNNLLNTRRDYHVSCYGALYEEGCIRSSYDGLILLEQRVFATPAESNTPTHLWGANNVVIFMHGSVLCDDYLKINAYFELKPTLPIHDVKQVLMRHLGYTATTQKIGIEWLHV